MFAKELLSFKVSIRAMSFFLTIAHNDRGYGHLAICGSIRCRPATG